MLLGAGISSIGSRRLITALTFVGFIRTTGGLFRMGCDTILKVPAPNA